MKNLFLSLLGAAIFILIVGLITKTTKGEKTVLTPYLNPATYVSPALSDLKKITIGKTIVMASIADTKEKRSTGLGGITNLPIDQGMLFVFESKAIKPTFWMKDMKIPLDFIWIANNKVSEISPNIEAPARGTPDKNLKLYTPINPIDYVLEVNAGFAERNNIKVGDPVILP